MQKDKVTHKVINQPTSMIKTQVGPLSQLTNKNVLW